MAFADDNTVYAVGNQGVILKSTDKGLTWNLEDSASIVNLNGICFTGSSKGYIVGDMGTLLTTDAGGAWTSMESGTHYHLNAVGAASNDLVFAAGYKGMILKQSGDTWEEVASPTIHAIYCIDFASETVGIAAGDSGTIVRTADGGTTWSKVDVPYNNTAFLDVYFPSATTGYLSGQQGVILKTTDGGITWSDISYPQYKANVYSVDFYDDNTGYACGANGVVMSTVNGGANWVYYVKSTLSFSEIIMLSPKLDSVCDTILVCGDNGIIMRSDSCINKMTNVTHGNGHTISSIRFPVENKGYAVGGDPFSNKPFLARTTDGENWAEFKIDTIKRYLTAIDFVSPQLGYMSSTAGFVYKFIGDSTAVPLKTKIPEHLYDIRAIDETSIYAAGLNGTLIKTISGDTTWKLLLTNTTKHLYSLYFFNKNSGYAVGEGGTMLRIKEGGSSIKKVSTGTTVPLYDVYFKDELTGFIVGYNGKIIKVDRSSGTEVFTNIPSGITTPLNEVYFPSADIGYIAGESGVVLKSTDGGESWLPQHTGTQNGLRSLYFKSSMEGWVAGAGVSILKTENGGGAVILPGIAENQKEKYDINLYPNPATNQTWIEFELKERKKVNISVFDLAGRQVGVIADKNMSGTVKYKYNTSVLKEGIYLLIIDIDGSRQANKLVIMR